MNSKSLNTTDTMSSVTVEKLQEKYVKDVDRLRRTFMDSKKVFGFVPFGVGSERTAAKEYKQCPDMMNVCGVAVHPEKGAVGFIQLVLEGMPIHFHKIQPGEAYVAMVAVKEGCQGMGIGSALLAWAEKVAKERGCTFMFLEVMYGNPAKRLYERKGYVVKPLPLWKRIALSPLVFCCVGVWMRPKGSPSYCNYGQFFYMEKPLE